MNNARELARKLGKAGVNAQVDPSGAIVTLSSVDGDLIAVGYDKGGDIFVRLTKTGMGGRGGTSKTLSSGASAKQIVKVAGDLADSMIESIEGRDKKIDPRKFKVFKKFIDHVKSRELKKAKKSGTDDYDDLEDYSDDDWVKIIVNNLRLYTKLSDAEMVSDPQGAMKYYREDVSRGKETGMKALLERLEMTEGRIPQEDMKRAEVRSGKGATTYFDSGASKYGLSPSDLVGWFANKYNMASGWSIFVASPEDKSEFGSDVFRTYTDKTHSTSIIKFNLKKGTYAFLDNKAYEEGDIKFEKMSPYSRLLIDNVGKAYNAFGIV